MPKAFKPLISWSVGLLCRVGEATKYTNKHIYICKEVSWYLCCVALFFYNHRKSAL